MKNEENQLQPNGICRKIYNFIINYSIARGMNQLSLGSSFKPNGEEMEPLQARARSKYGSSSGEMIEIHLKDAEEHEDFEKWSHIDHINVGPLVHLENESQMIKGDHKAPISLRVTGPVKSPFMDEKAGRKDHTTTRGKAPQGLFIKDKGKNVATEDIIEQPNGLPKVTRHPINVLAQNINERSESFINSRKAAMRRSHLEHGVE